MRTICLSSILLFFVWSCSGDRHNFTVEVDVNGTDNSLLYLAQRTLTGIIAVDSASPDKSGKYLLKGYTDQPDFYIVYHHPKNFINLIIHPGDKFKVLTDVASFDVNYLVEGSKDSRLIQKMVNMQTHTLEQITEISTEFEKSRGSKDFDKIRSRIDNAYSQIVRQHKDFSIQLIEENPESLAGLMALYQQLGRNTPVFDYKKDFKYYALVDSNLSALYPRSEAVMDLNRKVTELKDLLRLETGSSAPDIALPDPQGRTIALSSLKGKKVLLVFWASWSSQSLSEIKKLNVLYPKIAGSDLEYFQVSLDRTRDSWLKIVNEKNTYGLHVSDLKYWDSPVVALYHIEQLPVVYLIDERGVIMGKDIAADELPGILKKEN
jgi:peroxiredoxin